MSRRNRRFTADTDDTEERNDMTPTEHGPGAGASGQRDDSKATSSSQRARSSGGASASGSSGGGSAGSSAGGSGSGSSGSSAGKSSGSSSGSRGGGARVGGGGSGGRRPAGDGEVTIDDRVRVLIGPATQVSPFGVSAPDLDVLVGALEDEQDVTILHRVAARPPVRSAVGFDGGAPAVVSAEMSIARAAALQRHLQLVVEVDGPLEPTMWAPIGEPMPALPFGVAALAGGLPLDIAPFYGSPLALSVAVTDPDGEAVAGALVRAVTRRGPALGITDAKGQVELMVLEDSAESVRLLSVTPARDHWSRWIPHPRLEAAKPNTVVVERFEAFLPAFGEKEHLGWGLRAMRIDQLPPGLEGRGVKIALVDSGAAKHPDLPTPAGGFDVLAGKASGWTDDPTAHGTHALGIIAGGRSGAGVGGIAPEADVVVYKVLPGGRCSTLIEAIDRCIEEQVDVINLGVATAPSVLLEQRLQQARQLGIACIAAAGNTAGPVAYPASSPAVLTVAAVGHLGEFPADSQHAGHLAAGVPIGPDGFFAAGLSAYGPEIDVCGPGVAVVSTVPPDGYAAWDGTSAAAAHVSGLVALLLAHHPDFAGPFRPRTAARVDRLFDILRRCARPLAFGDPRRTGAGLPDALVAFGGVLASAATGLGDVWSPSPTMAQAGIANGNGGNGGNGKGGQAVDPSAALAQLRATLEQAGIWRED